MRTLFLAVLALGITATLAQNNPFPEAALSGLGSPSQPKVWVAWNRFYDWKGIGEIAQRLQEAYPNLCTVSSIGKSYQGRDIWLITISNPATGEPDNKPAFYIDGNIHSNEIQGSEVALYTAWYLLEMYRENEWIRNLVDERTFYIVPTINPDARDHFLHQANSPHSPRSGLIPRDDDGDGLLDEDGYDDLDGDGNIVQMRKRDPLGRYKPDPEDPRRLTLAPPDEFGEYILLGWEGYDNDGDGQVNEDGPGFYDPNRTWAWDWAPRYVQWGSDQYPFCIPETRAVADFVMAHPNIAGAQSYHNAGGMILAGPGEPDESYPPEDARLYKIIGQKGEHILPGYRYMVVWRDLYPVLGGEFDWFYNMQGILTFSNELWTPFNMFRDSVRTRGYFGTQKKQYLFDKYVLFEEGVVPWKKIQHPQYGEIEIGGIKKNFSRIPPGFLLEEECHRNMAFTLFHAYQMPLVKINQIEKRSLGNGLTAVDVEIVNQRLTPTHLEIDLKYGITPPDLVSLSGENIVVHSGFLVEDPYLNHLKEQEYEPEMLRIKTIPGMGRVRVRWLVSGSGKVIIKLSSVKGGQDQKEFTL